MCGLGLMRKMRLSGTMRTNWKELFWQRAILQLEKYWPEEELHPNYVDIIAANSGWLPLVVDEKMTVTLCGKMYEIKRIK